MPIDIAKCIFCNKDLDINNGGRHISTNKFVSKFAPFKDHITKDCSEEISFIITNSYFYNSYYLVNYHFFVHGIDGYSFEYYVSNDENDIYKNDFIIQENPFHDPAIDLIEFKYDLIEELKTKSITNITQEMMLFIK